MQTSHIGHPGMVGIPFDECFSWAWNRAAATLAVGELVQLDHTAASTDFTHSAATGNDPGDFTANVITPVTGSATVPGVGLQVSATAPAQTSAIFGVVVDLGTGAGADNALVKICWRSGNVLIKPVSGGTVTKGLGIYPTNAVRTVTAVLANQKKCLGFARITSTANDALTPCIFDGITGFATPMTDLLV